MKNLIDIINEKLVLSKTVYKNTEDEYLYHEALEDGYSTKFIDTKNVLQYSIDNCNTWHKLKPDTKTPEINKGDRIYFRGENMKCMTLNGIGVFNSNKKFNIGGNIMSLIYGDDFILGGKLMCNYQFKYLFCQNINLISAKDLILPASKLTEECYYAMFVGCESLTESPKLPATELTDGCYYYMFGHCKSLTEITMLATDISAWSCLYGFVKNVSGTGTFTKAKNVDIEFGEDGIPEGWTVKEI